PATLRALFQLGPLTARDAAANAVLPLLSLPAARSDCPMTLQTPPSPPAFAMAAVPAANAAIGTTATPASRPDDSVNNGNLPSILHSALRQDLLTSKPEDRSEILAKVAAIRTRRDAMNYLQSVQAKVRTARSAQPGARRRKTTRKKHRRR